MNVEWRVYGSETVAARIDPAEVPGFFKKKLSVGPHEAAVIVRDGRLEQVVTADTVDVRSFWGSLKLLFTRREDVDVIVFDTAPLDLRLFFGETTKDHKGSTTETQGAPAGSTGAGVEDQSTTTEETRSDIAIRVVSADREVINGECRFRVQIDPSDAPLLAGLLKGRDALATWDLVKLLRDEILAKVVVPQLAGIDSSEMRQGGAQNEIAGGMQDELQATLATWGLRLRDFYIGFGFTAEDQAEIDRKRAELEERLLDFVRDREIRELERQRDVDLARLELLHEVELFEGEASNELEELQLIAMQRRERMEHGQKVELVKIAALIREVERDQERLDEGLRLAIEQREAEQRLAIDKQDADQVFEDDERRTRLDREMDRDEFAQATEAFSSLQEAKSAREAQEQQHHQAQMETQTDAMKSVMSEAIQWGNAEWADSEALGTMMGEMTKQRALDRESDKVDALSRAEAAKANLDTFKDAEDRERGHQKDITAQAADLMEASKQDLPRTLVQGGGAEGGVRTVVSVREDGTDDKGQAGSPDPQPHKPGPSCGGCGAELEPTWKACPSCGESVETSICPSCNEPVQPSWKACPSCGASLVGASACPGCSNPVEPGWKACPSCGQAL